MLKTVNLQKWQHEKFEELCKKMEFDFGKHHWVNGPNKINRQDGVNEEISHLYYHTFNVRELTDALDYTALDDIAGFVENIINDAFPLATTKIIWDYHRFMFHCESSFENNKRASTYLDFQEVFNIMLSRDFKSISCLN